MANIGRILSMIEMDAWHHLTSCHVRKYKVGRRLETWSSYIDNNTTGHFLAICMVGVGTVIEANTAVVQNKQIKIKIGNRQHDHHKTTYSIMQSVIA
jgi:hypothetical protein